MRIDPIPSNLMISDSLPRASVYGVALLDGSRVKDKHEASRDDLAESTAVLEEVSRTSRRVLGPSHPFTKGIQRDLLLAQEELTAFDAS